MSYTINNIAEEQDPSRECYGTALPIMAPRLKTNLMIGQSENQNLWTKTHCHRQGLKSLLLRTAQTTVALDKVAQTDHRKTSLFEH